jgi:hypothetical protein
MGDGMKISDFEEISRLTYFREKIVATPKDIERTTNQSPQLANISWELLDNPLSPKTLSIGSFIWDGDQSADRHFSFSQAVMQGVADVLRRDLAEVDEELRLLGVELDV